MNYIIINIYLRRRMAPGELHHMRAHIVHTIDVSFVCVFDALQRISSTEINSLGCSPCPALPSLSTQSPEWKEKYVQNNGKKRNSLIKIDYALHKISLKDLKGLYLLESSPL